MSTRSGGQRNFESLGQNQNLIRSFITQANRGFLVEENLFKMIHPMTAYNSVSGTATTHQDSSIMAVRRSA
jgi:hypothetical protein